MAKVVVSTGSVNFKERESIILDAGTLRVGRGYLFFLRFNAPVEKPGSAYVNIIGVMDSGYGVIRSPLITKCYAAKEETAFYFVVPDAAWGSPINLSFEVTPKELVRGASGLGVMPLTLSWEDSGNFKSEECQWGG